MIWWKGNMNIFFIVRNVITSMVLCHTPFHPWITWFQFTPPNASWKSKLYFPNKIPSSLLVSTGIAYWSGEQFPHSKASLTPLLLLPFLVAYNFSVSGLSVSQSRALSHVTRTFKSRFLNCYLVMPLVLLSCSFVFLFETLIRQEPSWACVPYLRVRTPWDVRWFRDGSLLTYALRLLSCLLLFNMDGLDEMLLLESTAAKWF